MSEALPLISSYLYSDQVSLDPMSVGSGDGDGDGDGDEDEYGAFSRILRIRHAIACGLSLKPILAAIERGTSQTSEVVRAECKGVLVGRLDIPLYLSRRGRNLSWPRTFPVLVPNATPDTPENRLIHDSLRHLVRRLTESGTLDISAERAYCGNLLRWSRKRLHADPWAAVSSVQNAGRLRRETEHRLRKRQTGNEAAYREFLAWHDRWLINPARSDPESATALLNVLLAFPAGEFFGDRVFEIWCLHQVIESLRRCGAVIAAGPRMLSQRAESCICELWYEGYRIKVWFQNSFPSSLARWHYIHSRQPLRGIPDIMVTGDDGRRLVIDAKRREVRTQTRSEETYKMLGYVDNFRDAFATTPFWGVLCFLSKGSLFTELAAGGGHKMFLIGAHDSDPSICAFEGRMDTILAEWLSLRWSDAVSGAPPSTIN